MDTREGSVYIRIQFVPHRKHYVSVTKRNRLMLFGETVAVYCENRMEHRHTLCVGRMQRLNRLKQWYTQGVLKATVPRR
jgi:hypothetical protein